MKEVYTMSDYLSADHFSIEPGQEISDEVYRACMNAADPLPLPAETARAAAQPIHSGFLMGKPARPDAPGGGGPLYHAFGENTFHDTHCFYLGLSPAAEVLNGEYYFMDCMNAFVNDGLFPVSEFESDQDAIRTAADYEATLYRLTFKDGEETGSVTLYDPIYC